MFQDLVEHDLTILKDKVKHQNIPQNLTLWEKKALKEIKNNKDLIVRRADKGGAIAILNGGLYRKFNQDILSDRNTYTQQDLTVIFLKKLKSLLQEKAIMGAITQKLADKLFVTGLVVPILHSFTKIHKEVFPPPIRPIVAGLGSLGEWLENWNDCHLQPIVAQLPEFILSTLFQEWKA